MAPCPLITKFHKEEFQLSGDFFLINRPILFSLQNYQCKQIKVLVVAVPCPFRLLAWHHRRLGAYLYQVKAIKQRYRYLKAKFHISLDVGLKCS